jgi:RHS repeat-associated protein
VLDSITYDSFGNVLSESSSSSGDRFKYTSREWDSEIGQYYYRARYYGPNIGRFESEDPLGFASQDTDLYRYARNNPTYWVDPTGTDDDNPWVPVGDPFWQDVRPVWKRHWEEIDRKSKVQYNPTTKKWDTILTVTFQLWVKEGTVQRQMQKYAKIDPRVLAETRSTAQGLRKQANALRANAEFLYMLAAVQLTVAAATVPIMANPLVSPVGQYLAFMKFAIVGSQGATLEAKAAWEEKEADQLIAKADSLQKAIATSDLPKIYEWSPTNNKNGVRTVWGDWAATDNVKTVTKVVPEGAFDNDYQVPPPD